LEENSAIQRPMLSSLLKLIMLFLLSYSLVSCNLAALNADVRFFDRQILQKYCKLLVNAVLN